MTTKARPGLSSARQRRSLALSNDPRSATVNASTPEKASLKECDILCREIYLD